jgi:hypothetical protein
MRVLSFVICIIAQGVIGSSARLTPHARPGDEERQEKGGHPLPGASRQNSRPEIRGRW